MTDNPTRQSAEVRYFICDGGGERIDWIVGAIGDQKCATHPLAFLRGPFREQSADHPAVETPTKADWVPTCRVAGCPNGVLNDGDGCSQHPPAVETPTEPMDRFCWCNHPFAVHVKGADPRFQETFCDDCNHAEIARANAGIGVCHLPAEQPPAAERHRRAAVVALRDEERRALEQRINELEGERFTPLGDNHHNAAKCPYCNPEFERQAAHVRTLEAKLTAAEKTANVYKQLSGASIIAVSDLVARDPELQRLHDERQRLEADNARLQSALTAAEKERASLRMRMFGCGRVKGSSHTTACTIWGDNGRGGTSENFPEPLPCNCGAIENFLQSSLHAAEEKIAALTHDFEFTSKAMLAASNEIAIERDALRAEVEQLRGFVHQFMEWYPRVTQLLDGWHADGTAWSEWDESVRRELIQLGALAAAKMEKGL
jgi:hypothetical protein